MSLRAPVNPKLLHWACERAGADVHAFAVKFPKLEQWVSGNGAPTLKQLEAFARATHTPLGLLFLQDPPEEKLSIPDFRTVANRALTRPSAELLDTIYLCEQRQEWYRDFALSNGEPPVSFVGSATTSSDVERTAQEMRKALSFDLERQRQFSTWTDALRHFIECADNAGILVMCSGVVRNDNTRKLDSQEFRGFAIADVRAPLVFVNGSDSKSAQMFTLAHELAHVWLGASALSDSEADRLPPNEIENWCNRVAAEFLVPRSPLLREFRSERPLDAEVRRLAGVFKVSTLVVLRRVHDIGGLTEDQLWKEYRKEKARIDALTKSSGGGNFYLTQAARVGKRFARALVVSTLEGQTLRRDAMNLLGFSKHETFAKLGRSLGVFSEDSGAN